jgi:hypothetical protein
MSSVTGDHITHKSSLSHHTPLLTTNHNMHFLTQPLLHIFSFFLLWPSWILEHPLRLTLMMMGMLLLPFFFSLFSIIFGVIVLFFSFLCFSPLHSFLPCNFGHPLRLTLVMMSRILLSLCCCPFLIIIFLCSFILLALCSPSFPPILMLPSFSFSSIPAYTALVLLSFYHTVTLFILFLLTLLLLLLLPCLLPCFLNSCLPPFHFSFIFLLPFVLLFFSHCFLVCLSLFSCF